MSRYKELSGKKFGDWLVLAYLRTDPVARTAIWQCRCICGKEKGVRAQHLVSGNSKGCGCEADKRFAARLTSHGMHDTAEYNTWQGMKTRCINKNDPAYKNYGGRGLAVCERWKKFENFYEDMGDRPSSKYSIERVNNDKGYSPDNCVWATRDVQNRNHRRNRMLTYNNETLCITDWAKKVGVTQQAMQDRLQRWPLDRALTEMVNKNYQRGK